MLPLSLKPYVGNPEVFPILRAWDFFNHAGVAPLPAPAAEAMVAFARQAEYGAYLNAAWFADVEKLRTTVAAMINCTREEIAFVKNTSEGLSIVASGVEWQFGDQIISTNAEYPANIYPWMEVARSRGAQLVLVEEETDAAGRRSVPTDKLLAAAQHPKARLMTLSHVEFASGQRHDLAALGAFCRQRGILLCVDAIQSLGALPIDVKAMNIDYLSADGHKWLLGPEGAAVFYCRKELLDRTRPLMVGWMNVVEAKNHTRYDYRLRADAGRFECGTYNVPGLLCLKASVDMINAIGVNAISERIKTLGDRLIDRLQAKGYHVLSPRDGERWSGIISFVSPRHHHEQLLLRLRKEFRTEIALREGRLRASPHFYNTEAQLDRFVGALPDHKAAAV